MQCPLDQLARDVALAIDSHFTPWVENELKAAMQINPNGFSPAFTLLGVPLTGIMMINEKCFAPLHQALMQSGMNFCIFFFFFGKKGRKRENSRWESNWLLYPARLFAYRPGWRLPGGWCCSQGTGLDPCLLPAFILHKFWQPEFSMSHGCTDRLDPLWQTGELLRINAWST